MVMLNAQNLTCLRGQNLVFEKLSLSLRDGEALLLTGFNGSGKSSLLRLLAGLIEPLEGGIFLNGLNIQENPEAYRMAISYLGHKDPVKPTLTVRETLEFEAVIHCIDACKTRIEGALEALNLETLANTRGSVLSSGQKRRVSLARLLLSESPVWLLDEPTVGLDTLSVTLMENCVDSHRQKGGIVLLSTHIEFRLPGAQALDLGDFAPKAFLSEALG